MSIHLLILLHIIADAAVREVKEETGIDAGGCGVGVAYSDTMLLS